MTPSTLNQADTMAVASMSVRIFLADAPAGPSENLKATNGKQLIRQTWVEQAMTKQVPNDQESHAKIGIDWQQGYGFQFWRCTHNAFRGDGAGGQLGVVIPDQDMVVAITAQTGDFQREINAVWDNLLPACGAEAIPEDAASQEERKASIANLVAHPDKKGN